MPARSTTSRRTPTRPAARESEESTLRFGPVNGALFGAGLVAIVSGFVLLSAGSTVAAPLLLVLGYVVLVPWGIIH